MTTLREWISRVYRRLFPPAAPKDWGDVRIPTQMRAPDSGANQLPAVGRIQILTRSEGFDYQRMAVTLKYTDRSNGWHQVEMPFLDAMYLLNLLKAMQQDVGYALPEDPYAKKP